MIPDGDPHPEWLSALVEATFRSAEGSDAAELSFELPTASDAFVSAVRAAQRVGPLDVLGGEIVFQIEHGAVVGISGHRAFTTETDVALAWEAYRSDPLGARWHVELGPVVEMVADYRDTLVDPWSGRILQQSRGHADLDAAYEPHTCRITHNLLDTTNPLNWGALVSSPTGPTSNCGRENYGSLCVWELSREGSGTVHQLGQLNDHQSSAVTDQYSPCSSAAGLMTSTAVDKLRQQNMYYYTERFRSFLFDRMWNKVTRDQHSNVQINIEEDPGFGQSLACFNRHLTDIYIKRSKAETGHGGQTILHEYGHYVNATYGHFSTSCTAFSDEGNALNETFADINALAFAARDAEMALTYRTANGFVLSQFPGRHREGTAKLVYDPAGCAEPDADDHDIGRAAEQAMWELLWNQDCETGDTCPTSLTSFGDDIWPTLTKGQVNDIVSESIARALQATGQSATYDDVLNWFLIRVQTLSDAGARARARAVLVHHGFSP